MAQIEDGDDCWYPVIEEYFTGAGRGWGPGFVENSQDSIWQACCPETTSGVTTDIFRHSQAYQPWHSIFNNGVYTDNKMRLVASYEGGPQTCGVDYIIPSNTWHNCSNPHPRIYYHSGIIQSYHQYGFGYFEARCAMPVHQGVHASFWLWGGQKHYTYEEIDIMEYLKTDSENDIYYGYSSGIWYNKDSDMSSGNNFAKEYSHIPSSEPDIQELHIYGCKWLPDHVVFYRDGQVIKEYRNRDSIPQNPKWIKMSYAINQDEAIYHNGHEIDNPWMGRDTLTVDHIKYYALRADCDNDLTIQSQQELEQFNTMKRSVTIGNSNGLILSSTVKKVIRAEEYIVINGPFELQSGGALTLLTHECPGVHIQY